MFGIAAIVMGIVVFLSIIIATVYYSRGTPDPDLDRAEEEMRKADKK